jgi:hypothetical protein
MKVDKEVMKASDAKEAFLVLVAEPITFAPLKPSQEEVGILDSLLTSFGNPLSV